MKQLKRLAVIAALAAGLGSATWPAAAGLPISSPIDKDLISAMNNSTGAMQVAMRFVHHRRIVFNRRFHRFPRRHVVVRRFSRFPHRHVFSRVVVAPYAPYCGWPYYYCDYAPYAYAPYAYGYAFPSVGFRFNIRPHHRW
jgi:hypothetical protein